jgi:hypothetical protein
MKIPSLLLVAAILVARIAMAAPIYDCSSPRPEMAGFHNMVLFGVPGDELYVYHLPLFAGAVNGSSGHVLMHVYQGLWNIQLDAVTKKAYDLKFSNKRTSEDPFPFFSIAPKGNRFKVPEMICNPNFSLSAAAVFGHVESNPDFPAPEQLVNQLSTVSVKGETVFARRFDGISKTELIYFIFGTPKQYYMAHFLTDDENSFDQIVAVEIESGSLKNQVVNDVVSLVSIPVIPENDLISIPEYSSQKSPNNKWKLPVTPLGKTLKVTTAKTSIAGEIKIVGEIYFNNNSDLRKKD